MQSSCIFSWLLDQAWLYNVNSLEINILLSCGCLLHYAAAWDIVKVMHITKCFIQNVMV